jgi:hypothetical protein
MRLLQRFLRGGLALIVLSGALLMVAPPRVSATTGPTIALPPSRFKVALSVAKHYAGVYKMTAVPPAAKITSLALGIEVNTAGYLFGYAQFYGYDIEGYQTLWINVLYNFHQMPRGTMSIDLLGQGGGPLLGKLLVTRSKKGDLTGRIELTFGTWPISFQKIKNEWTPAQG